MSRFFSLALLSVIWFALGWVANERLDFGFFGSDPEQLVQRAYRVMTTRQYPVTSSAEEVADHAILGMLEHGKDPHAAYYRGLAAQRFRDDFLGKNGAPGLYFTLEDNQFVIVEVVADGPAEKAGLLVGDQLVAVDGVLLDESSSGNEVSILLRGPVEEPAEIRIRRAGEQLNFDVGRQIWAPVTARMLEGAVAYISQRAFTEEAARQFRTSLERLLSQEPAGLVWDLRGNRGGSMEAAQQILSHFISEGTLFSVELKRGAPRTFEAEGESLASDIPLLVLIDERSLSAAETSALTIRDHGRGTILGSKSGGKGTIQDTIALDEEHLLHVTIGKWYSPSEAWIDGLGVVPDVEAIDDPATVEDEVLQAALNAFE